jgi:hypothetical protein
MASPREFHAPKSSYTKEDLNRRSPGRRTLEWWSKVLLIAGGGCLVFAGGAAGQPLAVSVKAEAYRRAEAVLDYNLSHALICQGAAEPIGGLRPPLG